MMILTANKMNDFDTFWAAYPWKAAKKDARKAWEQSAQVRPSIEAILTAISAAKESRQWREGFVPLPATWLRGERWDDEHEITIINPIKKQETWWTSDAATEAYGNSKGCQARPGETMQNYRERLKQL
jgi:hypothetical protein